MAKEDFIMSDEWNMYIGGKWTPSVSGKTREIICPADGKVIAVVAEGDAEDVRLAVKAAQKAFYQDGWKDTSVSDRMRLLYAIADEIDAQAEQLAQLETLNSGKPLRDSLCDMTDAANCFRYYAGLINKPTGQVFEVPDPNMQSMVVREPIGVCGQIVPWNYPLLMAAWKLAPCLAAGNTSVFKPAEITPLTAICLFRIFDKVGLPAGVGKFSAWRRCNGGA
jgi:betaine-aldehyde dehydrogenase